MKGKVLYTVIFLLLGLIGLVIGISIYLYQCDEPFTVDIRPDLVILPPIDKTVCVSLHPHMDPVLESVNRQYAESQGYTDPDSDYILYLGDSIIVVDPSHRFDEVIRLMGDAPVALCRERLPRDDGKVLNPKVVLYKRGYDVSALRDMDVEYFAKSSPIENGYPVRKGDVMVFNEDSFNGLSAFIIDLDNVTEMKRASILQDVVSGRGTLKFCRTLKFPFDRKEIDIIPRYLPVRSSDNDCSSADTSQSIPKRIFQTFNSCAVPKGMRDAIATWIEKNPEYTFSFYDDTDCTRFLIEHFDDRVVQAYNDMIPGAFKADLWRYCVLYVYGGVYIDAKSVCVLPLREIIRPDDTFITVVDRAMNSRNAEVYNAFICSVPNHPILRNVIYEVVDMVERRDYGDFVLDITGPRKFGKVVYEYIGYPAKNVDRLKAGYYPVPDSSERIRLFDHRVDLDRKITDEDDRFVIFTRYRTQFMESGFLGSITGKRHYVHYWLNGKVYKEK